MRIRFKMIISFLLFLAVFLPSQLFSDDYETEKVKKNLPKLFGANNVGKEFWLTIPPCYEVGGAENFIKVFVTSPVKTLVNIDVPGKGFHTQKMTIPNDVIEFKITPAIGQPFQRQSPSDPSAAEKVYQGFGMNIYADQSIVVYVVVRYTATSDGYLAIPVSSLGREYIVASYGDMGAMYNGRYPSESGIVAAYDKTKVTFTLGGNAMTRTGAGMKPGQVATATLNKGDVWMFTSDKNEGDLTGSKIVATKPVAVVSGNYCTNIPTTNRWCDYTVEMDLPLYTWGLNYHVAKVPGRLRPPLIRVFAREPNTLLFRDGKGIGNIQASGGVLGVGYLEMRLTAFDGEPRSAVISGDKPIGVTMYNPGVEEDGYPLPNSDPFIEAQTPMEQYQKEITFCTPGIYGGQNFPENYLNLVYETNEYGFMGDDVKFAEVSSGEFQWTSLRSKFSGADELFKYDVDGRKFAVKTITLPKDGVYKIKADRPFAAYSFGYSWCDSYGYPTSAALMDITRPDTLPPVPTWLMLCDGTINGAKIKDMPDNDSVRVNLSLIEFIATESYNYAFSYKDFEAGIDRETTWELSVIDKLEDAKAVIAFADRNGNDTIVTIEYNAVKITIRPDHWDFGLLEPGKSDIKDFWAINESKESPVQITKLWLKTKDPGAPLADQGFELLNVSLPFTIPKNDSVKFQCRFNATKSGSFMDSIGIGDTCVFSYVSQVRADVGLAQIMVSDIDFQTRTVGEEQSNDFTIQNPSPDGVPLVITGYDGNYLSVYSSADLKELNISETNPLIVEVGNPKTLSVRYKPTAVGTFVDSIVFRTKNASGIDSICKIIGKAVQPQFVANGYDWGRRRIHRAAFPIAPYSANGQAIELKNDGTKEVKIKSVTFVGNPAPFLVNKRTINESDFVNLKIDSAGKVLIAVEYQPTKPGPDTLLIKYDTDAGSDKTSLLTGIGIVPRVTIEDGINFDTTLVNDKAPKTRLIKLTNPGYQWEDTLLLTNLVESPAGSISGTFATPGTLGFSFDRNNYAPKRLAPGESLTINAQFVAQQEGAALSSLRTVSDAEAEDTSNWKGWGVREALTTGDASTLICVGEESVMKLTIKNEGSAIVKNVTPTFKTGYSELSLADAANDSKFDLGVGETHDIEVRFAPPAQLKGGTIKETIIYDNESQAGLKPESQLTCEYVYYPRASSISPTEQSSHVGGEAVVGLRLDGPGGAEYDIVGLQEIDLVLKYDNDFLYIDNRGQILEGAALGADFTISPIDGANWFNQDKGEITVKIKANPGARFNAGGELLKVNFRTYLPAVESKNTAGLTLSLTKIGTSCTNIDESHATISLMPICVDTITHIALLKGSYYMGEIMPNPVGPSGADVKFGLALEGMTTIGIYNEAGKLVKALASETMQPGEYSLPLPVQELSNGVYMIRMVSGPANYTRRLVIAK